MRKILTFVLALAAAFPVLAGRKDSTPLTVMSYNIRMGEAKDGSNSWQYRYPATALMIKDQMPDVLGIQEAYDYQVHFIAENFPEYKCIGVGREDGKSKGEHMSIFYNKKALKLCRWGTYWLSDTPDEPSLGWDARCKRTATWALFKDKRSGRSFYMVNTHLDHIGVEARAKGLALIMDRIGTMNKEGFPLVVTGDFNMNKSHPSMSGIASCMKNARESAIVTDDMVSFNGWGKFPDGKDGSKAIDFIWYTGFSSCMEFHTVTESYFDRKFISDHFPIKAKLLF